MNIELEKFRKARGSRLVLVNDPGPALSQVRRANLSLASRISAWRNGGSFRYGTHIDEGQNRAIKQAFYNALANVKGDAVAEIACKAAGCRSHEHWIMSSAPLSDRQVARILAKAYGEAGRIVVDNVKKTKENFRDYVLFDNLSHVTGGGNFFLEDGKSLKLSEKISEIAVREGYFLGKYNKIPPRLNPVFQEELWLVVKAHESFARVPLTVGDLDKAAESMLVDRLGSLADEFASRYAKLMSCVREAKESRGRETRSPKSLNFFYLSAVNDLIIDALKESGESLNFCERTRKCLNELNDIDNNLRTHDKLATIQKIGKNTVQDRKIAIKNAIKDLGRLVKNHEDSREINFLKTDLGRKVDAALFDDMKKLLESLKMVS